MTMTGVYADWEGIDGPLRLGWLHARKTRSTEKFEYESDPLALQNRALSAVRIDPDNRAPEGREWLYPGARQWMALIGGV